MKEILLSSPLVHFYLLCFIVLGIGAIWPGKGNPPQRKDGSRPGEGEPGICQPGTPVGSGPRHADLRLPGAEGGLNHFAVRHLEAAWSAEYADRFAQAIRRIRLY
jgi:hypothetical protein